MLRRKHKLVYDNWSQDWVDFHGTINCIRDQSKATVGTAGYYPFPLARPKS